MSMQEDNNSVLFKGGAFKFSGADIDSLQSSKYTLVGLAWDTSWSVAGFVKEMTEAAKNVIRACADSKRSDNLLVRVLTFDRTPKEVHGFKELIKCNPDDYNSIMNRLGDATALFDASVDLANSIAVYGKELYDSEYTVNGIFIVITDGLDNHSTFTPTTVKEKLNEIVGEKKLESLVSILVGVNINEISVSQRLNEFQQQVGFTQYIELKEATPKSLAKLAQFISKSISSQSKSLGTGTAAPSLNF
jgi:hypothetical protein